MKAGDIEMQRVDINFPPRIGAHAYYDKRFMLHESHVVDLNKYKTAIITTDKHTRVGCHYSMPYINKPSDKNSIYLGKIEEIHKITMNGLTFSYKTYTYHKADELNRQKDNSNVENKTLLTDRKQSCETLGLNIDNESKG